MRIYQFFIILILFFFNNFIFSSSISFSVNCKVQDSILVSMEDGKSTRYSSWENDIDVGDYLNLRFKFTLDEYDESYKIVIKSNIGSEGKFQYNIYSSDNFKNVFPDNRDLIFYSNRLMGTMTTLGDNALIFHEPGYDLSMFRYYKNDWNLIFTSTSVDESAEIKTANCLGVDENYSLMTQVIRSIHRNN